MMPNALLKEPPQYFFEKKRILSWFKTGLIIKITSSCFDVVISLRRILRIHPNPSKRIYPTCAIKKSNIYNLISGIKAPEGRNIGNYAKPSGISSPSGAQYWFCAPSFTHITPRWGLELTRFGIFTYILHLWCVFD
jgi:hypothetical protein